VKSAIRSSKGLWSVEPVADVPGGVGSLSASLGPVSSDSPMVAYYAAQSADLGVSAFSPTLGWKHGTPLSRGGQGSRNAALFRVGAGLGERASFYSYSRNADAILLVSSSNDQPISVVTGGGREFSTYYGPITPGDFNTGHVDLAYYSTRHNGIIVTSGPEPMYP
jgi:hypothetical protein